MQLFKLMWLACAKQVFTICLGSNWILDIWFGLSELNIEALMSIWIGYQIWYLNNSDIKVKQINMIKLKSRIILPNIFKKKKKYLFLIMPITIFQLKALFWWKSGKRSAVGNVPLVISLFEIWKHFYSNFFFNFEQCGSTLALKQWHLRKTGLVFQRCFTIFLQQHLRQCYCAMRF